MVGTDRAPVVEPLNEQVDHVRGEPGAPLILEYGDYECPYSRQAFRSIERVERELSGRLRFAFRHFLLTQIHPHALAAEAAARQGRFWEMHTRFFHRQKALEDETCGRTRGRSDSSSPSSTAIGRAPRSPPASLATWQAARPPGWFAAHRQSSSTASSTRAATTRPRSSRRLRDDDAVQTGQGRKPELRSSAMPSCPTHGRCERG